MPKDEDEIFSNMRNCVVLIIVFTSFIYCSDLNVSDDLYSTCPFTRKLFALAKYCTSFFDSIIFVSGFIAVFRRKREQPDYTRWRANIGSTQEFIVKVLDDDLTTPNTKKVVAINIQPFMKGGEKIIIGGVMVPKPSTTATPVPDITKDYTRFVLPTTVATRADGELYLAPIAQPIPDINKLIPIPPHGKFYITLIYLCICNFYALFYGQKLHSKLAEIIRKHATVA